MLKKIPALFLFLILAPLAWSDEGTGSPQKPQDLTNLDIEDLMKIQVTTASKKAQSFFSVPSAISVLTQEDIRHSGARSLPEALRMIPGVQVAQINASVWAITIRGFNGRYANKLLVMIDGRSIYNPIFGGVRWEEQDVLLEDVERIEVIRGPGGSLWGANAVNGIINIITKHTKDTQGNLLTTSVGNEESGAGSFRHGGMLGAKGSYRLWGKTLTRGSSINVTGMDGHDGWDSLRGGFRADWDKGTSGQLMFQGDTYRNRIEETEVAPLLTPPYSQTFTSTGLRTGWNLLGRWTRQAANGSEVSLQAYAEYDEDHFPTSSMTRHTYDLDFQHRLAPLGQHNFLWGLGYRHSSDKVNGDLVFDLDPAKRSYALFSAFVQDEIELRNDLRLTLGSKFEHNDFTGFEFQPSARLAWTPSPRRMLWASVTRAVTTPSRVYEDMVLNLAAFPGQGGMVNKMILFGNKNVVAETVLAHEIGYRFQPEDRLLVDVAAFYNVYRNVTNTQMGAPYLVNAPIPHLVLPLQFANNQRGETYGLEINTHWNPTDHMKLTLGYALLTQSGFQTPDGSRLNSPRHQVSVGSFLDLPGNLELNTQAYWIDKVRDVNAAGYLRLDVNLVWKPSNTFELSVGGRNLLDRSRQEFGTLDNIAGSRIERSFYGRATWRF